ncbi:citrate lyase subunit beta / citryl-CoA lyase [Cupriavidus sp. YR651]|uniref:HpcH/HpaI aldolase/citrate lyase family protein n=1 Tax=Cupriavidus sp. YR651 TaxID=1855315 RepID=UPI00088008A5|nr:aldolase/citrate lyase family protein [Cupriavidus sp. YR651]SDD82965.1 citrate lyase subunit beta / citryl-CoA lyase [Cupriavidus sp. YR651]
MTDYRLPASWLSLLYVPGHDLKRLEDAVRSGAHGALLDLEDFVPESEKAKARQLLPQAVARCRVAAMGVAVRINRRIDRAVADVELAVNAGTDAIMVTKTLGAQHLILLDELIGALEIRSQLPLGRIKLIALVETAAALGRVQEICRSTKRLYAIGLGGEDIAKECSMHSSEETLRLPKQQMIFEAIAAGIVPIGYLASVADYRNQEEFSAMVSRSKAFGFQAATCINAEQVAVVNQIYAPNARDIDLARSLFEGDLNLSRVEDTGHTPQELEAERLRAGLVLARNRHQWIRAQ